jgi:hypothetical protein
LISSTLEGTGSIASGGRATPVLLRLRLGILPLLHLRILYRRLRRRLQGIAPEAPAAAVGHRHGKGRGEVRLAVSIRSAGVDAGYHLVGLLFGPNSSQEAILVFRVAALKDFWPTAGSVGDPTIRN